MRLQKQATDFISVDMVTMQFFGKHFSHLGLS
jgi:hypothetical protein